jgi:hypothetical protein
VPRRKKCASTETEAETRRRRWKRSGSPLAAPAGGGYILRLYYPFSVAAERTPQRIPPLFFFLKKNKEREGKKGKRETFVQSNFNGEERT